MPKEGERPPKPSHRPCGVVVISYGDYFIRHQKPCAISEESGGYSPGDMPVIRTHAAFHPRHILVRTERSQDFSEFLADLLEETLSTLLRDEYDRSTAIPAGGEETVGTHGHRPPWLENWLAKPFLGIATEDFSPMPHGFSYSVLPRIAWGLMFELRDNT